MHRIQRLIWGSVTNSTDRETFNQEPTPPLRAVWSTVHIQGRNAGAAKAENCSSWGEGDFAISGTLQKPGELRNRNINLAKHKLQAELQLHASSIS